MNQQRLPLTNGYAFLYPDELQLIKPGSQAFTGEGEQPFPAAGAWVFAVKHANVRLRSAPDISTGGWVAITHDDFKRVRDHRPELSFHSNLPDNVVWSLAFMDAMGWEIATIVRELSPPNDPTEYCAKLIEQMIIEHPDQKEQLLKFIDPFPASDVQQPSETGFSALTNEDIDRLDDKYLDRMSTMPVRDFWKELDKTPIPYKDVLYLIICKGTINEYPGHAGPLYDDHIESSDTLAQLNHEGVLTLDGQRSIDDGSQRNYLSFDISFEKDELDKIIKLMETLHAKGLNVWASIKSNGRYYRRKIALFKAPRK